MSNPRNNKRDPWVSLPSAASALGIDRQTVLVRALKGDLTARVVADRVVISRASIDRALAIEGEPGVVESEDVDRAA